MGWELIADALGSRHLWLAIALVEMALTFLSQVPGDIRRPPLNLAAGFLSSLALLLVVGLGWFLVLRRLRGGVRIIAAFPVLVLAAVVRGAILQLLLVQWGMSADGIENYRYRIMVSLFVVLLGAAIGVALKVGVDGNRSRLTQLEAEQERLTRVLAEAQAEVRADQTEALQEICGDVVNQLAAVPGSSALFAADSLDHLAVGVVRPLSHYLADSVPAWQPPEPATTPKRLDWARVWGDMASPAAVEPVGPAVVALVLVPASAVPMGVAPAIGLHVVLAVLVFVGLWLVRHTAAGVGRSLSVPLRLALTAALAVLACVPAAAASLLFPAPQPLPLINAAYTLILIPIVAMLFSFIRAALRRHRQIDDQLSAIVAETNWWVARTQMQRWWQRGTLARALHGPVQTAIHSASQRLRADASSSPERVESVLAGVRQSLPQIVLREASGSDLVNELAVLSTTWRPLVQIEVIMEGSTAAVLATDQVCAEVAMDIISEAVSNAVRHGGARTIDIIAEPPRGTIAAFAVIDDGSGWEPRSTDPGRQGLGRAQLDRCTLDWDYAPVADGNRLSFDLPFTRR